MKTNTSLLRCLLNIRPGWPLLFVLLVCCHDSMTQPRHQSQPNNYLNGVTYSRQFSDVFSTADNPAILAGIKNIAAGVTSERRFMLDELEHFRGIIAIPFAGNGAALVADHAGTAAYNESKIGLALGKALAEKFHMGIEFTYYLLHLQGYGTASSLGFAWGTLFKPTDRLTAGIQIRNPPLGGRSHRSSGRPAALYAAGFGYDLSEKLFLSARIEKEEDRRLAGIFCLHYAFVKELFVRAGVAAGSPDAFFGVGVAWKICRFQLAAGFHPQLGVTPSATAIFFIRRKTIE